MKLLLLVLSMTLVSCGNNHGFGFDYEFITPLGIEFRRDAGVVTLTAEEIDEDYLSVRECLGYSTEVDSLMIIISDALGRFGVPDALGVFTINPNLIVLKSREYWWSTSNVRKVLRHEFVHYLLFRETGSMNQSHTFEGYVTCT